MAKFDIQVTVTVEAADEEQAEAVVGDILNDMYAEDRAITHWEFTEFVPCDDLRNSCCC